MVVPRAAYTADKYKTWLFSLGSTSGRLDECLIEYGETCLILGSSGLGVHTVHVKTSGM